MKFTKAASLGSAFQEKKNVVHLVNGWQKSMHKEMRAGLSKREASLPGKGLEMSCEADPTQGRRKRCFKQGNVLSQAQEAGACRRAELIIYAAVPFHSWWLPFACPALWATENRILRLAHVFAIPAQRTLRMKLVLGSVDLLSRDKGLHPLQLWSGFVKQETC